MEIMVSYLTDRPSYDTQRYQSNDFYGYSWQWPVSKHNKNNLETVCIKAVMKNTGNINTKELWRNPKKQTTINQMSAMTSRN